MLAKGILSLLKAGPEAATAARGLFLVDKKGLPQLSSKIIDDMAMELSDSAWNLGAVEIQPGAVKSILRNKIFPGAKDNKELYNRIRKQYAEDMSVGLSMGDSKGLLLDEIVDAYEKVMFKGINRGVN